MATHLEGSLLLIEECSPTGAPSTFRDNLLILAHIIDIYWLVLLAGDKYEITLRTNRDVLRFGHAFAYERLGVIITRKG